RRHYLAVCGLELCAAERCVDHPDVAGGSGPGAQLGDDHPVFRRTMRAQGVVTHFKALWSPVGNYLCLAFVGFILVVMLLDSETRNSVFALPVWVALVGGCYWLKTRKAKLTAGSPE